MAASNSMSESGTTLSVQKYNQTSATSGQRDHPVQCRRGMRARHEIFLSHSGAQKPFVNDLYNMLSLQYITFFDIKHHSLPLTESFPDHIFDAAKSCKLAIVVLSDEFLCSRWPMLELSAFVEAKTVKILPLFFKLSPKDLSDKGKHMGWLKKWQDFARQDPLGRINVPSWEEALRKLRNLNGPVFKESEQAYLQEIMSSISLEILPRAVQHDVSGIQGTDRLCKIILDKFDDLERKSIQRSPSPSKVCHVLRMYGPSGSGKSTLSRCIHEKVLTSSSDTTMYLELPTNPSVADLVKTCKHLLNYLTSGFYSAQQLEMATELRQMYKLFWNNNLQDSKVFLVLDNISTDDPSIDMVHVILRLCVGPGSKVLLVARTYNALRRLIPAHHHDGLEKYYFCDTISVPSLNKEEALRVLLQCGDGVGLDASYAPEKNLTPEYRATMEKVVCICGFRDKGQSNLLYLPLVLKMMGHRLREVGWNCVVEWEKEMTEECKRGAVQELVQNSFDRLGSDLQLLFLDLACFYLPVHGHSIEDACALLSAMHERSPEAIECQMYSLERRGFLSMQDRGVGRFSIHDVFLEFAASIPDSCMYFYFRNIDHVKDEVPRNQLLSLLLELNAKSRRPLRVIYLELGEESCEILNFPADFSSVRILSVRDSKSLTTLGLVGLTSLVSLEVANCPSIKWVQLGDDNHQKIRLRRLSWSNGKQDTISGRTLIPAQNRWSLRPMQVARQIWQYLSHRRMRMEGMIGVMDLTRQLRCLEVLRLENTGIRRMEDMGIWWPKLKEVVVVEDHLEHFKVGNLPSLQRLHIRDCHNLAEINGLEGSTSLQQLHIKDCHNLAKINGLEGSTSLQELLIWYCHNLAKINGLEGSTSLQWLGIEECHNLAEINGLEGSTSLQRLYIQACHNLAEINGLEGSTSLQVLDIQDCDNLAEIKGSTSLQSLYISECHNLAEIKGSTSLQSLYISECPNLAKINVLEGSTSLQELGIRDCHNLAEINGLEGLTSLQWLDIAPAEGSQERRTWGLQRRIKRKRTCEQELYIRDCLRSLQRRIKRKYSRQIKLTLTLGSDQIFYF